MKGSPDGGITRAAVRVPGEEIARSPGPASPTGLVLTHSTVTRSDSTAIAVRHLFLPPRSARAQGVGSTLNLLAQSSGGRQASWRSATSTFESSRYRQDSCLWAMFQQTILTVSSGIDPSRAGVTWASFGGGDAALGASGQGACETHHSVFEPTGSCPFGNGVIRPGLAAFLRRGWRGLHECV